MYDTVETADNELCMCKTRERAEPEPVVLLYYALHSKPLLTNNACCQPRYDMKYSSSSVSDGDGANHTLECTKPAEIGVQQ